VEIYDDGEGQRTRIQRRRILFFGQINNSEDFELTDYYVNCYDPT
jgi:hypothetical protein